ncbi:hypothetical protein [Nocardia terpenica]|uniref:hypothetical protein n=1 Tax=Nocardia terpenica TaxID=455432 RepID=UPI000AD2CE50|nr:hypothetical protein [Nocardia terpenica]NQE89739.1 hypothetical protein [Nocardia terpenica]
MTTELDHIPSGSKSVVAHDVSISDPIDSLARYAQAIDIAYELADKLCRTALVPAIYRSKPADGAVAILYGAELGLNPIQSLQQIFTVHGAPAIYARTMVALLKAKGYRIRTVSSSDESVTVSGTTPDGETETSTWTVDRASKAGYVPTVDEKTGKYKTNSSGKLIGNEKYLSDPQAMLYAKAAAEVCRKLAPDVLLGIAHTREDLESEPEPDNPAPVRVRSERVSAAALLAEPTSDPVEKPDMPEAPSDEPAAPAAAEPEPPRATDPAELEQAAADTAPREDAPTQDQITQLGAALRAEGLRSRKAQLAYLDTQFRREIGDPADLTASECATLTQFLMTAPAAGQLPVDGEPVEGGDR